MLTRSDYSRSEIALLTHAAKLEGMSLDEFAFGACSRAASTFVPSTSRTVTVHIPGFPWTGPLPAVVSL